MNAGDKALDPLQETSSRTRFSPKHLQLLQWRQKKINMQDRSMEPCGLANGSKHEGYQGNEATRKLRDQPMEHLWRCTGCNGWKRAKMWEWFLIVIVCSSLQPRCVVAVFFSRACKGTLGSFVGAALANASCITKQYLQSEGEQIHTNTK